MSHQIKVNLLRPLCGSVLKFYFEYIFMWWEHIQMSISKIGKTFIHYNWSPSSWYIPFEALLLNIEEPPMSLETPSSWRLSLELPLELLVEDVCRLTSSTLFSSPTIECACRWCGIDSYSSFFLKTWPVEDDSEPIKAPLSKSFNFQFFMWTHNWLITTKEGRNANSVIGFYYYIHGSEMNEHSNIWQTHFIKKHMVWLLNYFICLQQMLTQHFDDLHPQLVVT